MSDDPDLLHLFPIAGVRVGSLLCECGACGGEIVIEIEALDEDRAGVDPAHDFHACPDCGGLYDAQAARFSAELKGGA